MTNPGGKYGNEVCDRARFKIGASAVYVQVGELARILGVEERHVKALCAVFPDPIPMVSLPGQHEHYILLYALETALFALGLPKAQRDDPVLARAHQELAGLLYGGLTKQALATRVELLAKTLTSGSKAPKIRRKPDAWKRNAGKIPRVPISQRYEPLTQKGSRPAAS